MTSHPHDERARIETRTVLQSHSYSDAISSAEILAQVNAVLDCRFGTGVIYKAIRELRQMGEPVCSAPNHGYWWGTPADVDRYCKKELHTKAAKLLKIEKAMRGHAGVSRTVQNTSFAVLLVVLVFLALIIPLRFFEYPSLAITQARGVPVAYSPTPVAEYIPTLVPVPTPPAPLSTATPAAAPTQTPEIGDDGNAYNGYWWRPNLWVPGLVTFDTQFLRMPPVTIGSAVFYAPEVMGANVIYRGLSMDGMAGAVSIEFCSEIGHHVWLLRPGFTGWEGPFVVADCSRRNDLYGQIVYQDQVVEVDFDTAVRWGMARYGGAGNEGLNNAGRWTALTGRLDGVLLSMLPPEQYDGTIIDLSFWFLQRVTYAEESENRGLLQNYRPPAESESLPAWLIDGEWVTFP